MAAGSDGAIPDCRIRGEAETGYPVAGTRLSSLQGSNPLHTASGRPARPAGSDHSEDMTWGRARTRPAGGRRQNLLVDGGWITGPPLVDNLPLTLAGKRRCQRSAHRCRLGAYGGCDLARDRGPAWWAALAWLRGRAVLAGEYQAIRLDGPLRGRPAVRRGAIRERAGGHGEDAPGAQPSVKVSFHAPVIGSTATIVAGDRAQRIGRGQVVESYHRAPRGPWRAVMGGFQDSGTNSVQE